MEEVRKKSSEIVHDGFLKVEKQFFSVKGKGGFDREILRRQDAAGIVLYDKQQQVIILVKQFRSTMLGQDDPYILEIPAGMLEEEEEAEQTIIRETLEETGYKIDSARLVQTFYTSVGYTTERCHIYYAQVTKKDKIEGGGGVEEETEYLEIVEIPVKEAMDLLDHGKILDGKTLAGLWWFRWNIWDI